MPDKELGKLWADTDYMETGYSGLVASLIGKLVEERKNLLLTRHAGGALWTDRKKRQPKSWPFAISILTLKLGNDIRRSLAFALA
jgi:hypothetical protein